MGRYPTRAMSHAVGDWLKVLDGFFPPSLAEPWDNVGLQVGDRSWPADRVLVALDPTIEVIREAAERGCAVVVTHHPLLFRPLASLDLGEPVAAVAGQALASRVAVAAYHTNADAARPGVTDALAEVLELRVTGVLRPGEPGDRVKLVTFVPTDATAKVLDALALSGGGTVGEYTSCSFRVTGTGTFRPSEAANPTIGERGELTEVTEDRLEMVVPGDRLASVTRALIQAHPYEEVAYDVYPLLGGEGLGPGRLAEPDTPLTAAELADRCRRRLGTQVRIAGELERQLRTVALCGGAGAFLVPDAAAAGADAFVTGDLKHHQALDAVAAGLTVIDGGHHGTEWPFVEALARVLAWSFPDAQVLVSEVRTDPFHAT
jgi:dinuclear metal center YbgI/SA1388 family protein